MDFWVMTPCSLVDDYQFLCRIYCVLLHAWPWIWRQYVSPKLLYPFTRLHGVISQKIALWIFTAVKRNIEHNIDISHDPLQFFQQSGKIESLNKQRPQPLDAHYADLLHSFSRDDLRDSAIDIANVYGLDDRGVRFQVPVDQKFSPLPVVHTGSEDHPDSYPMGIVGCTPGVKRPGREADHSPPTIAEVNKMWIYKSTPTYVLIAQCLIS
jgi:hypothetical protein